MVLREGSRRRDRLCRRRASRRRCASPRSTRSSARIEAANGKEVPKVQYDVGEEVKINDGAFANLTGRIDEIDPDRGKLKFPSPFSAGLPRSSSNTGRCSALTE